MYSFPSFSFSSSFSLHFRLCNSSTPGYSGRSSGCWVNCHGPPEVRSLIYYLRCEISKFNCFDTQHLSFPEVYRHSFHYLGPYYCAVGFLLCQVPSLPSSNSVWRKAGTPPPFTRPPPAKAWKLPKPGKRDRSSPLVLQVHSSPLSPRQRP